MRDSIEVCGVASGERGRQERRLAAGEVAVYRFDLGSRAKDLAILEATLSPQERERAVRLRFAGGRDRFVITRGLLRVVLSQHGAGRPQEIRLSYGPKGKPALTCAAGIEFNLSHSGDLAVMAVARDSAVGIDVERVSDSPDRLAIARRFFSRLEVEALDRVPTSAVGEAFYRCWTRKEAYLKARGDGLSLALDSFDVSLETEARSGSLLLSTRPDPHEARRWHLLDLDFGRGHAGALAVELRAECTRRVGLGGGGERLPRVRFVD